MITRLRWRRIWPAGSVDYLHKLRNNSQSKTGWIHLSTNEMPSFIGVGLGRRFHHTADRHPVGGHLVGWRHYRSARAADYSDDRKNSWKVFCNAMNKTFLQCLFGYFECDLDHLILSYGVSGPCDQLSLVLLARRKFQPHRVQLKNVPGAVHICYSIQAQNFPKE